MAVSFSTSSPKALLDAFKNHVNQENPKDKITTWEENRQGNFTHKAAQVAGQAWMCPEIEDGVLHFYIRAQKGVPINRYVYSYYHGHLTETFINHFPTLFTRASSTANAIRGDNIPGNYSN